MKLAAKSDVVMKACPAIPTRVIQESDDGIFQRKFKPYAINNTLNTNRLLLGSVNRAIRKLAEIEVMAFFWCMKIPCGVKNAGTISHMESKPKTSNNPCARSGLAVITNAITTTSGVPIMMASMMDNTESNIVCKTDLLR